MDEKINTGSVEEHDYDKLKNKIKAVLRRHFPTDDNGDPNPEFDDCFTAEQAIDDIHDIIGDI